jgi:hypothetical protein
MQPAAAGLTIVKCTRYENAASGEDYRVGQAAN